MKKTLFFFFISCFSLNLFAQKEYQITINSHVINSNTKKSIYNANVGFVNKNIGTLSDRKGHFKFIYNEKKINDSDTLRISAYGYITKNIIVSDLYNHLLKSNIFLLEPKVKKTDVQHTNTQQIDGIKSHIGTFGLEDLIINPWETNSSLGSEIASKINIYNQNTRIEALQFNIVNHTSDNTIIRINIYNSVNGVPQNKIIGKNIYHIIKSKKGIETIDLSPYNIIVDEDIFISLELIRTNTGKLELEANSYSSKNYKKNFSHGQWNINDDLSTTFKVQTTIPKINSEIQKTKPENIILYWDTSISMEKNRNIHHEYNLISKYLKGLKTATIKVIKFSSRINESKTFNINNGDSKKLISYLRSSNYDGGTNYSTILKDNKTKAKAAILFTDGCSILEPLKSTLNIPIYCITSNNEINENKLKQIAYNSGGNYINLNKINSEDAITVFSKKLANNTLYENNSVKKTSKNLITGVVKGYDGQPVQGVNVREKNSFNETLTDSLGNYNIAIKEGEALVFTYSGLTPKEVIVTHSKKLDIQLFISKNTLDEVVIKGRKKETVYEKKKREATITGGTYIGAEDIPDFAISISDILSRVPGITIKKDGASVKYSMNRLGESSNTPVLFVIDGIQTIDPSFVIVTNIESIVVLKSLASATIYGTQGRGGVIKIKTKNRYIDRDTDGKIIDQALITGNDYTEELPLLSNKNDSSPYLKELNQAKSFNESLKIYANLKKNTKLKGMPFYMDSAEYFLKWDKALSFSILQNINDLGYNNVKALKALAYKYEELNKFEDAKYIYKHILKLQPNASQSYRDYAQILTLNNAHNEAMSLYKIMRKNNIKTVNFKGIDNIIISELRHILSFNKADVDYNDIPDQLINKAIQNDIRLVFEWNNPNAEFELQFVNPKKKYYKWSYSSLENQERISQGLKNGYNMEEFIIDNSDKGEWIININSSKKYSQFNPTYLKYTVYKNYGLQNETKVIKVLKLYQFDKKITIDKLTIK